MNNNKNKLVLADTVRIFSNGLDELRIRKGVWNYEEAILSLSGLEDNFRNSFVKLFNKLDSGEAIDTELFFDEEQLIPSERSQLTQIIEALQTQDYLYSEGDQALTHLLYEIIGGKLIGGFFRGPEAIKPVLFFADTEATNHYAQLLAEQIGMVMKIMPQSELQEIASMDLTTKYDGYDTRKQIEELKQLIEPYGCIIGALERPHVSLMRNLNRALIETAKPLSMALLDGPFTSVFSIKPPETGCFECMENRLLARLQDMQAYSKFVEHTRQDNFSVKEKTYVTPLMNSIVSIAIFEGLMISCIGKAKLAGRVLNTYLPIMEIQVQDILRVPYCPACGAISHNKMDEMYTSTKKMIDKLIGNIAVTIE